MSVPTDSDRLAVAVLRAASVTVTAIVDVPPAVGVPLRMPVVGSSVSHVGRPVALQV